MGGRSREPQKHRDRWSFISELPNDRLENYGRYTEQFIASLGGQGGIHNKLDFNRRLADEYQNRYGTRPAWETNTQQAVERSRHIPDTQREREIQSERNRRQKQ
ncbi:MAG: hypothetical protein ACU837_10735 [Gammaproteobacteria bacterium]